MPSKRKKHWKCPDGQMEAPTGQGASVQSSAELPTKHDHGGERRPPPMPSTPAAMLSKHKKHWKCPDGQIEAPMGQAASAIQR